MARTVVGLKELDAALAELPDSLARGAARRTMNKGGNVMAAEQKRLANPAIRDTIGVFTKARNLTGLDEYGAVRAAGGSSRAATQALRAARRGRGSEGTRITTAVGSSSPLAHLFERGTGPRFQKTTGRYTGLMPAEPFVRPAFDHQVGTVITVIKTELAADIARTRARYDRKLARAARG